MDGPKGIMLSMSVRERQIPYDFTYMLNLKNKIKQNGNRLMNTENRLTVARGQGVWRTG